MAFGLDDAIAAALRIVDKVVPDPNARAAAAFEAAKLKQAGDFKSIDADLQVMQMQADVNKVEAASTDKFVSRWRPFIGWTCGVGLATQFLVAPLATWISALMGKPIVFPPLDMGTLITLLFGMLGLGGMRTIEKINGASK